MRLLLDVKRGERLIMKISELKEDALTVEQMTDLLFTNMEDDLKDGDCIFVPGSSKAVEIRLPKAIQLYQLGRAPHLIFSGGGIWGKSSKTEAALMKEEAVKVGIQAQAISTEEISQHTKENVLASLLVVERALGLENVNRILVVTTIFHMRRMLLTLQTYMPPWIHYSICIAPSHDVTKENWQNTPVIRSRVETEAKKIVRYVQQGILSDDDVIFKKTL